MHLFVDHATVTVHCCVIPCIRSMVTSMISSAVGFLHMRDRRSSFKVYSCYFFKFFSQSDVINKVDFFSRLISEITIGSHID